MSVTSEKSTIELELAHYWRTSQDIRRELAANVPDPTILEELCDELIVLRDFSLWAPLKLRCLSDVVVLSVEIVEARRRVTEIDQRFLAYRGRI